MMLTFVGGGISAWYALKQIVALLAFRVTIAERHIMTIDGNIQAIENDIKGISSILIVQATQKRDIEYLQRQIDELKHGEGFVLPISRSATEVPPKR